MHFVKAKGILSSGNSMNIYRGCTHGCIYCDSRSSCYRMDHEFEDIEVKVNALELLEAALKRKRRKCMLGLGCMSDPYIPLEMELGYTRKALSLACRYGFGFSLLTKSTRVLGDIDILRTLNEKTRCIIQMTLTTYDEKLSRILEPNVSSTHERFEALKILREEGIPTVVWISPILPFINDTRENLEGILSYCLAAEVKGVVSFGMGLTLREGNREYYYSKLDRYFPGLKKIYQEMYGSSYEIISPNSRILENLFHSTLEKGGILHSPKEVFSYISSFPEKDEQLSLF